MKLASFALKYAGIAAIPVYICFTFFSHLHNPMISPLNFWLSDFGNPLVSPSGAGLYNAGCVLTAVLLAIFYGGIYRWYGRGRIAKKFVISYAIAQAGGLLGTIFLALTAAFPLGTHTQMHSLFSKAHMICIDFFLSFTATGFLLTRDIPKYIGILGYVAFIFNIVTMNAFDSLYLSEWIFFMLFMAYIVFVTGQYDLLLGQKTNPAAVPHPIPANYKQSIKKDIYARRRTRQEHSIL